MPMVISQVVRRSGGRAQFVLAHPEDILWCSGLALSLLENEVELALVCLTRGEAGPAGKHPRDRLGSLRERELRASAEVLGISRVHFLGYIDLPPKAGRVRPPEHLSKKLGEDLREQFRRFSADVLITHGSSGEGWDPAHVLLHHHVLKALRTMRRTHQQPPRLVTINAWDPSHPLARCLNHDDTAHLVVHADKFADRRIEAVRCHETQAAFFDDLAGGIEGFVRATAQEPYRVW
ncbi:MAG: PIG-L deacetylase family protein [Verrucomicrobiales bacterium]